MTNDLTSGKITPQLIKFTIPMILGNLFQLTYNAADSIIVGRFIGKEALAAVGISSPIATLMILFLNGMCMGAGVLMSTQYGAKDYKTLERQISTTAISGIVFSVILTVFCIVFTFPILNLMQTDEKIILLTARYLRIIFLGLVFTYLYNFFSSALRALGDSKTPLLFLIISSVLNISGDLLFVIVLKAGSVGCAVSTVISEAVSCMLCIIYIKIKVPIMNLGSSWFVFDKQLLKQTLAYSYVTALQQATVQLGKLAVQSAVNTMGVAVTAAFTVVNRIDDFAYTPEQNIGHSMTALIAQSRGARKDKRVKKGFKCGMAIELCYGTAIFLIIFFLAKPIMSMFSSDSEVIRHGQTYLKIISAMYIIPSVTNGMQGYFRGIGDLKVTLLSSFTNMAVRFIAVLPMIFIFHFGIEALPFSYLIGWVAMLLTEIPLFIKSYLKKE